jgi:hypothetical protein
MISNDRTIARRDFLVGGIAGACVLSAATPVKPRLRFGLTSYQWGKDWDIPTMIANCTKAKCFGLELRTSANYAHGVEVALSAQQRSEVKKRFVGSPVALVSIASAERMDWPTAEKLRAAIEAVKAHLQLSHDVGALAVRVFPNQFQPNVPHEKTIAQIAKALNDVGRFAADLGQEVALEAHGPAGDLPTMRAIMEQVTARAVRVRLNCDDRDARGKGFRQNFDLVKHVLAGAMHIHGLKAANYPYPLHIELLVKADWDGWSLMENSDPVPDRVQALIEQRETWETMVAKVLNSRG